MSWKSKTTVFSQLPHALLRLQGGAVKADSLHDHGRAAVEQVGDKVFWEHGRGVVVGGGRGHRCAAAFGGAGERAGVDGKLWGAGGNTARIKYPTSPLTSTNHNTTAKMAIAPIVGRLRKGLVLDLSVALGIGTSMGYLFWYGYHIPAIRQRDAFYAKIEQQRIANSQS
ncbi:uncharacterized protein LAJ45_08050 [Morchella importuna]|nr:uncharacterized protein LAJ45_08050 [Morchella importuna]KAH8147949.1 hypothetical protein LAJ45_08050 [Morchella importuna]